MKEHPMRKHWQVLAALALVALSPALAHAQKPIDIHVGGVVMAPLSDTADRFGVGYGFNAGLTWNVLGPFGLRADYVWSSIEPKTDELPVVGGRPLDVSGSIQFGTADVVFQAPPGRVRLYVLAGGGLYRRQVSVSVPAGESICDPWLLVCGPVTGTNATRSTTDFGVNVGFGLTFSRVFVEGRYHFMWGPDYDTAAGTLTATGKFFPLTVGVRF
jgi:hypothetical protein